MVKKSPYAEIVTGNRLTDGAVVYLGVGGVWVDAIEKAVAAETEDQRHALETAAGQGVATQAVTGWEFAEITEQGGIRRAIKNIQHIRSLGPTVRRDLGKQAELYR